MTEKESKDLGGKENSEESTKPSQQQKEQFIQSKATVNKKREDFCNKLTGQGRID